MLTLLAPAKINWFLFVLGRRPDGYHDIATLLQRIGLYDTLTFEESSGISGDIEIITESPIKKEENLVFKAANALKKAASVNKGAKITLKKEIPVSAGLAGGSSDAAAALLGLSELWGLDPSEETLLGLAASLGSDVPFFLNGSCALAEGRGETLTPVDIKTSHALLLVKPREGVRAGWAYSETKDYSEIGDRQRIGFFIRAIGAGDFGAMKSTRTNGLEAAVTKKNPAIAGIKERLYDAGALFSAMSGSGSTVFGVFGNERKAEAAKAVFPDLWSRVARTLTSV